MASERQEWVKRLLDVCDARIVELAQLDQDHQRAVCDLLTDIRRLRDRLRFELDALP